jgi:hypothetical protein
MSTIPSNALATLIELRNKMQESINIDNRIYGASPIEKHYMPLLLLAIQQLNAPANIVTNVEMRQSIQTRLYVLERTKSVADDRRDHETLDDTEPRIEECKMFLRMLGKCER